MNESSAPHGQPSVARGTAVAVVDVTWWVAGRESVAARMPTLARLRGAAARLRHMGLKMPRTAGEGH
jgi:hypothetical protein